MTDVYSDGKIPSEAPVSTFSEIAYKNATLHVPTGTLSLYKAHPTWSKFLNIREADSGMATDVRNVEMESKTEEEIYSLSGIRMNNRESLVPGIYILKNGNSTTKFVVK